MDMNFMKRAIFLAKKGKGFVNPNPLVGAVIIKDNKIIGEGYHEVYGGPHAEVNAINNAKGDVFGATMYVTLEPCYHYGKTPPCVELIIQKKIARVVIGILDANPLVAGKSVKKLQEHGIGVQYGVMEKEIKDMNRSFLKFITQKRPYVILKTAMTMDGKISTYTGDSKWISGEDSRKYVQELRQEVMGIMVGIGTLIADDPSLTTRLYEKNNSSPRPIIVDSSGRISLNARIFNEHNPRNIILATTSKMSKEKEIELRQLGVQIIKTTFSNGRVNLNELIDDLGNLGIDSILLEGGSTLNGSAIEENIVDEIITFIAPKVIGGENSKTPIGGKGVTKMKDAISIDTIEVLKLGEDIMYRGKIRR